MTTKEPAWKKFLKLKSEIPVSAANVADDAQTGGLKRKREPLEPQNYKSILRKPIPRTADPVEKKIKENKQKKKAKTKIRRSKKDEADSKAAQSSALEYLSLYCSAKSEWKFSKPRQNYLLKHTLDSDMIPDDRFPSLLRYLHGLQGGARERCLETARDHVLRHGKQEAAGDVVTEENGDASKGNDEEDEAVTQEQFERAKQVVATLTLEASEPSEEQEEEYSSSSSESTVTSSMN